MTKKTETSEQQAVIEWRDWAAIRDKRVAYLYHIPNGELRNKAVAAKLKRMGVKAGMPDLHLPTPRFRLLSPHEMVVASLYIEMKVGKGGLSRDQLQVIGDLRTFGNQVEVCWSAAEAIEVVMKYLDMDPRLMLG